MTHEILILSLLNLVGAEHDEHDAMCEGSSPAT